MCRTNARILTNPATRIRYGVAGRGSVGVTSADQRADHQIATFPFEDELLLPPLRNRILLQKNLDVVDY